MLAIIFVKTFFAGDIDVTMEAPKNVKQGEEFIVKLTIKKGSIAGVGHMKQELPEGLKNAVVIDAKGAEFKYLSEDNVVKFTWISLPPDQEYTVSYKVSVNADAINGFINLGGKFSYVLNNEKQTFLLPESKIMVGEEIVASNPTPVVTKEPEVTPEPEITEQEPEVEPTATAVVEPTPTTPTQTSKTTASVSASRRIVGSPEAGIEFTVEINVKKEGMKGFARIQEFLPAGLTAKPLENKGGTFSFIDQKVKIIWDNLPADEDLKVAYRVMPSENASGSMNITGFFSYVENDDPKKSEIPTTTITIKAKDVLSQNNITDPENPIVLEKEVTSTTTSTPSPEVAIAYKIQICALSKIQRETNYFQSKFSITDKINMEFHEGWKKYIVGKYNQYQDARNNRENIRAKGVENPFVTAYNGGKRITVQEALMVSNQKWVP